MTRYWPFAVLGLLAGIYPALVIGAMLTSGTAVTATTNWWTPPESLASYYVCPRCHRLPHVEAVRHAQAKLPDVPSRKAFVEAVRDESERFCASLPVKTGAT